MGRRPTGKAGQTLAPRFVGEDFRPIPGEGTRRGWRSRRMARPSTPAAPDQSACSAPRPTGVATTIEGLGGLALSEDGTTLAVRSTARSVQLLDTATGGTEAELRGHEDIITAASFSADGTLLATPSLDETIGIWEVASGERIAVLRGHAGSITDVAFDDTATALYSAAADRSVVTWDLDGSGGLAEALACGRRLTWRECGGRQPHRPPARRPLEQSMRLVDVETGAVLDVPSIQGRTQRGLPSARTASAARRSTASASRGLAHRRR